MKKQPPKQKYISDEEFVTNWQTSDSVLQAAYASNVSKGTANNRAMRLRKIGVPLKAMSRGRRRTPEQIQALIELAESLNGSD